MDLLGSRKAVLLRPICIFRVLVGLVFCSFILLWFFFLLTLLLILLDLRHPCCY